jgi:uncharacterized protein
VEKTGTTGVILKWSRRIRWTLILLVLGYLMLCTYMWATQKHYIFKPRPLLQTTPDRLGLKFEEVHIASGSGIDAGDLFGWWLPADIEDAPTMLYLHGNDKNISSANDLERVARLRSMGFNLLMVDYRGYGKSSGGSPNEAKMYEDADAAWKYLIKQRGSDPKRTFIFGHSLGGAIAIDLAAHHPEAAGLIAESSFTSMTEMGRREFPFLPTDLLLNQRFDSIGKIRSLKMPVLLIHGSWDKLVPYQMSQRLFESALQPKFIKLIDGGEHGNTAIIAPLEYRAAIGGFTQPILGKH